jgi:hypothetical protein
MTDDCYRGLVAFDPLTRGNPSPGLILQLQYSPGVKVRGWQSYFLVC